MRSGGGAGERPLVLPDLWAGWDEQGRPSEVLCQAYRRSGAMVLRGYLDGPETTALRTAMGSLVARQLEAAGAPLGTEERPLEEGAMRLAKVDRKRLGGLYDTAMKTMAVRRLGASERLENLAKSLMNTGMVALNNNTIVRIDLPGEERFLFDHWHQDYPYAMVSRRGMVLWTPLVDVPEAIGPVKLRLGTHRHGLLPTEIDARGHFLIDAPDVIEGAPEAMVEVEPGDVVVFDLMLARQSSANVGEWPRWSLTYRYQDLSDPESVDEAWPCYYRQGKHFSEVHPGSITRDKRGEGQ